MNVGLLALLLPMAVGQPYGPADAPRAIAPVRPFPAPLLAARVIAPEGVRVTVHPGTDLARTFDAPAVLALRPGYAYRLELSNLPSRPGRSLYPVVEVRGSLVARPGLKYMDYPVPLSFTAEDLERVLEGAALTKVAYLEDPEKAVPAEARPDRPIELAAPSEDAAVKAAIDNGRPVAVVRMGDRPVSADELRATSIGGTILLPGERYLRAPDYPPVLPWHAVPLFDPIAGPKAAPEECLFDGGDRGDRLGIGPDGRLGGLNPTDVGVEFTVGGKRRVTSSNVVCICSPRFLLQRVEVAPAGLRQSVGPDIIYEATRHAVFRRREAAMAEVGREKPAGAEARIRPLLYVGREGVSVLIAATRPNVVGLVQGLQAKGSYVEPELLTAYPGVCPLSVTKSVDPDDPVQEGSVVTVTIRYANTGNRPASDIVVSDSLSGRLEYVPGSALSDRAANFASSENEAGSSVVRWEFPGQLLPGQRGIVKFQVRVR